MAIKLYSRTVSSVLAKSRGYVHVHFCPANHRFIDINFYFICPISGQTTGHVHVSHVYLFVLVGSTTGHYWWWSRWAHVALD